MGSAVDHAGAYLKFAAEERRIAQELRERNPALAAKYLEGAWECELKAEWLKRSPRQSQKVPMIKPVAGRSQFPRFVRTPILDVVLPSRIAGISP